MISQTNATIFILYDKIMMMDEFQNEFNELCSCKTYPITSIVIVTNKSGNLCFQFLLKENMLAKSLLER